MIQNIDKVQKGKKFFFKNYGQQKRKQQLVIFEESLQIQKVKNKMQNSLSLIGNLFIQQGLIHLGYKVISYIDLETLYKVVNGCYSKQQECKQQIKANIDKKQGLSSKIKNMIQVHYLFKSYLNKTDRSMYYSFYQQPQFIHISNQLQTNIVINQSTHNTINTHFSHSFNQIQCLFHLFQSKQLLTIQQIQELKRILVDPCLPMPSIKRQNQGMYCNSSFQLYLVSLRFPHYGQQNYTPFQQLKQKIQYQEDANFKQFMQIEKQKHLNMKLYENLHLVRYMPYQITYKNCIQLMLKQNTLHNMIVLIFAITDIWIESIFSLINLIDDPFYKLTELMSRYSVFKSFVIQIQVRYCFMIGKRLIKWKQENMGFMFQAYQNLYSDTIKDSLFISSNIKPKFCYWRPALAKWFIKISSIHTQTNQVYFMLLTKLRQQMLLQNINSQKIGYKSQNIRSKQLKKNEICLRNSIQLNLLYEQMRSKIYEKMSGSSLIQQFIINNKQTSQSIIFQYIQYMVDLAINEETVHWCGHSQHKLQTPFNIFNNQFQAYNQQYYQHLRNHLFDNIKNVNTKKQILRTLLQYDIQFLQNLNVKPVILRQIVQTVNKKQQLSKNFQIIKSQNCTIIQQKDQGRLIDSKEQLSEQKMQKQISKISKIQMQSENLQNILQGLQEEENDQQITIYLDFIERDQKLKYFNQKAKICQSIEGQQKCFFSIPPLLSPQQILTKSINTNDSSQNQQCDDNSSYQYVSDDQNQSSFIDIQISSKNQEKIQHKIQQKISQETPLFNVPKIIQNNKSLINANNKEGPIKKVTFQLSQCQQYNNNQHNNNQHINNQIDIQIEQQISYQKKTLASTNSSVKSKNLLNQNQLNQNSQQNQGQPSISKSQSI